MTNQELINQSSLSEQNCTCGKLYTNRRLVSPDCVPCNYREEVSGMLDKAREDERTWIDEELAMIEDYAHGDVGNAITKLRHDILTKQQSLTTPKGE